MKFKLGDTLIEVALAIGIFSMVAIAVVSVMSGSTSSAQSALELTVTREEIDAQAEALRFIQTSYVAGGDNNMSNNTKYAELWHAITGRAKSPTDEILNYDPAECSSLYNISKLNQQGAFIINTRNMGYKIGSYMDSSSSVAVEDVIVVPKTGRENVFREATTFPRLVYGGRIDNALLDHTTGNNLNGVEGIYIVAVKDNNSTTIVDQGGVDDSVSAYYDFYIRTCWFASGAKRPSTISTVIRLYNPDALSLADYKETFTIVFNPNDADSEIKATGLTESMTDLPLNTTIERLNPNGFERPGYEFVGWSIKRTSTPEDVADNVPGTYRDEGSYTTPNSTRSGRVILYAVWKPLKFDIEFVFHKNDGTDEDTSEKPTQIIQNVTIGSTVTINGNKNADGEEVFSRDSYYFDGWQEKDTGKIYSVAQNYVYTILDYPEDGTLLRIDLYAYWQEPHTRIVYNSSIDSQDCDSTRGCFLTTQVPSRAGATFVGWCSKKVDDNVACSGKSYQPGDFFPADRLAKRDTQLYPVWVTDTP